MKFTRSGRKTYLSTDHLEFQLGHASKSLTVFRLPKWHRVLTIDLDWLVRTCWICEGDGLLQGNDPWDKWTCRRCAGRGYWFPLLERLHIAVGHRLIRLGMHVIGGHWTYHLQSDAGFEMDSYEES